jgi:hypothetical protein
MAALCYVFGRFSSACVIWQLCVTFSDAFHLHVLYGVDGRVIMNDDSVFGLGLEPGTSRIRNNISDYDVRFCVSRKYVFWTFRGSCRDSISVSSQLFLEYEFIICSCSRLGNRDADCVRSEISRRWKYGFWTCRLWQWLPVFWRSPEDHKNAALCASVINLAFFISLRRRSCFTTSHGSHTLVLIFNFIFP